METLISPDRGRREGRRQLDPRPGSGEVNATSNPGLNRIAMKMATGTGKTVVMAMLIAWHALNKIANPKDRRLSDTFLVVTPGITIRDRLRVLLPHDAETTTGYETWSRPTCSGNLAGPRSSSPTSTRSRSAS